MSRPINKEWMNERNILSQVYKQRVEEFIEYAIANDVLKLSTILCPCVKCRNKLRFSVVDIRKHLIRNGINKTCTQWLLHGEDPSFISMDQHPPLGHAELEEDIEQVDNNGDERIGMENLVDTAYGVHDETCGDAPCRQTKIFTEPGVANNKYDEYKRLAAEKLYPSCEGPETTLSAIVELHNLKKQFGWSGNSVTPLLSVLKKWLSRGNTLPEKYPQMKGVMKNLGMKASFIHACTNNCLLYWKDNEDKEECPQCGETRYVVTNLKGGRIRNEPRKVLRHFPIIPRLVRFFTVPWITREFTWYDRATSSWDYQCHPSDSSQWRMFKNKWPAFAKERRNVWLVIATNEFNPRGIQSSSYSCWPVIVIPYNHPPSLCMKGEFQILSWGRVRGVGSHVTKKQLIHLGIAKAKDEANKVEKEGINALKDEFKSYVQEAMKVQFQDFQLAIQGTMQNMMADFNSGSPNVVKTPRSEFASNFVHRSYNLTQNLDNVFTPSLVERPNSFDKTPVILIDRENKELAKGYVVTDATAGICHGGKVGIGEKKVYIDEVLEPDAPLWFPQDGNDTFSAYVAGGYIIWFEPWLKYI